jgi:hypothetical protein
MKVTFNKDHAERVARLLFPLDAPQMWRCAVENCSTCDTMADNWQKKIDTVLNALKTLEN